MPLELLEMVSVTTTIVAIHVDDGVGHGVIPHSSEQYGNTVISTFVGVLNLNEERKSAVKPARTKNVLVAKKGSQKKEKHNRMRLEARTSFG